MWAYIGLVLLLAILDTLFGNKIIRGRIQVHQVTGNRYKISRWFRVFFIPVRWWAYHSNMSRDPRTMGDYSQRYNARLYTKDEAIVLAEFLSGKDHRDPDLPPIWDSRVPKPTKTKNTDDILELVPLLIEAVNQKDSAREAVLIEQINNLR